MKLNFTLLFLFFSVMTYAQTRHCGVVSTRQNGQPGSPAFENFIQQKLLERRQNRQSETEATYRIPVIVHIVHNGEPVGEGTNISAAQVYSQIEVLNEDFSRTNPDASNTRSAFDNVVAGIDIEFVPATIGPDGFPLEEPGIDRVQGTQAQWTNQQTLTSLRPQTIWDPDLYFNIWTLDYVDPFLGFAQFPIAPSGLEGLEGETDPASTAGVAVDYDNFGAISKVITPQLQEGEPYNEGRTLTHEVGHFFGLIHIWGDGGCSEDDFCEDTPSSDSPNFRCEDVDEPFKCGNLDMFENYMDYTRDVCMNAFTQDQVDRMIIVLENAPRRRSLLNSPTANPINEGLFANFEADRTTVCAGQGVAFSDISQAFNTTPVQLWNWTFEGGDPETSDSQAPFVEYLNPGTYDVSLYVEDILENSQRSREDYITVVD
ncbi:MAG: M43 family zinc metalloprotease, partial [Bacteroidota bacterium]